MKKLFPILALSMVIGLFSSCIIVAEKPTYTVYFDNDTPSQVYDWYLKDKYDNNYTISDSYCEVAPYRTSSMSGISEGDYKFYFCIFSTRAKDYYVAVPHDNDSYYHIEKDVTFCLSEETPYNGSPRSVVSPEGDYTNLVLRDSNGNVFPLKKVE